MKGLKVAGGLESAMLNVEGNIKKATTSASELTRQLQEVRDSARDISKITPFTQTEVVTPLLNRLFSKLKPLNQWLS